MNRFFFVFVLGLVIALVVLPEAAAREKAGLASLDVNGDHAISRQEAASAQKQTFERMDRDGNGVLSRDELKTSRPQSAQETPSDTADDRARALDQWVANLDTDDSGDISLAEYQAAMTPYFDRLDANGDGVIDGQELRRGYSSDDQSGD